MTGWVGGQIELKKCLTYKKIKKMSEILVPAKMNDYNSKMNVAKNYVQLIFELTLQACKGANINRTNIEILSEHLGDVSGDLTQILGQILMYNELSNE